MSRTFIDTNIIARRPESSRPSWNDWRAQVSRGEALEFPPGGPVDFFFGGRRCGSFLCIKSARPGQRNEETRESYFSEILTSGYKSMTICIVCIAATIFPFLTSCEQILQPTNKLIVYVNDNDEVPAHYQLRIYRDDVLVKSDEFDQEYSGFNNLTEIVNPPSGTYYFHAHSGDLSVRDSLELVSSASIKFVHLDLRQ